MARISEFQDRLATLRREGWEVVTAFDDPPYSRLRRPVLAPQAVRRYHYCEVWVDEHQRIRVSGPAHP